MRVAHLLLGGSVVVVSFLAACGGNVIVDAGQGGSSSSSSSNSMSSNSTGNPTSTNTGIMVSSSTGIPSDLCTSFCGNRAMLGCTSEAECAASCPGQINGACGAEFAALFQCLTEFSNSCDIPPCGGELAKLDACFNIGDCTPEVCSGSGSGGQTFCDCTQTCGMSTFESSCAFAGTDGKCECLVNGVTVGQCTQANSSCDPLSGCCVQFFNP